MTRDRGLGQKLQRYEVAVTVGADLEYLDHVGVVDGRGQRRLAAEPLQVVAVTGQAGVEDLDGDDLAAVGVEGAVDCALAARGDLFEDPVSAYALFHPFLQWLARRRPPSLYWRPLYSTAGPRPDARLINC